MDQLTCSDEIESVKIELSEIGRTLSSPFQHRTCNCPSSSASSAANENADGKGARKWSEIEGLPTSKRLRSSSFDENDGDSGKRKRVVDVTKLGALERRMFVGKLIKHIESDNLHLLQKLRRRIDRVGVKMSAVEVRYKNLCLEAECEDIAKLPGIKSKEASITIISDVSGIIKPGRLTLLLGPPGCGKTSLMKALSGNLDKALKMTGEVSYNGYKLEEFVPQKTSSYISQYDIHMPEITVRETLDFSARCQGVGNRAEIMAEVNRREKEAGIIPDPDIDTYMKAISIEGQNVNLQTDYILKILGLDSCADSIVGDGMKRGVSGGQKRRLITGEMIIGHTKALFMDVISNGLDSSITYQILACIQQLAHITDATVLVLLLQPAPEIFDLFDDIILMGEGKIVYHGPRSQALQYFECCGFRCPESKGISDFLQEVISGKDQAKYWHRNKQVCSYTSVDMLSRKFKEAHLGKKLYTELSKPFVKSQSHKNSISFSMYSLSKWALFKACMSREFLLLRRNYFVYLVKLVQLVIVAFVMMNVFLRRRMDVDVVHANYYLGALFYSLVVLLVNGFPELSLTAARLPVFYKQRQLYFYPAWAYTVSAAIVKIPLSFLEALVWASLTYYVIGYSPEAGRTAGSFTIFVILLFGGFIIPKASIPIWLKWGFWFSPLTYGEIGLILNEFLAPRLHKVLPTKKIVGLEFLESRGLDFDEYYYWISLGALFALIIFFNLARTLALSFLNRRMVLPLEPVTVVFQDVKYHVGSSLMGQNLQLLCGITGALRPGVLTALMGVSGSGKTTLMDVLAGRKTSGTIEGEIRIGGYLKEFVKEALEIVELDGIKDSLVGIPGLILLKTGGHVIYSGSLGQKSSRIIEYFEDIPGVPKIRNNCNPATWILDVTSTTAEAEFALDFAQVYKTSALYESNRDLVKRLCELPAGSKQLYFPTRFSQNGWGQFKCCLWKQHLSYWRSPSFNLIRCVYILVAAVLLGLLFWDQGRKISVKLFLKFQSPSSDTRVLCSTYIPRLALRNNHQGFFNIIGSLYVAAIFSGICNSSSVLPYVATERTVVSRERFAGMYDSWAYALAQVAIEVPYLLAKSLAFVIITYPMIGYNWSAYRVFWYSYSIFCTLLNFSYLGMLLVAATPSSAIGATLQSCIYMMFALFSGYIVPQPWNPCEEILIQPSYFFHIAANSQVVVVALLSNSNILDTKWHAYFPVWRCGQGDHGIRRNENYHSLSWRLLWISPCPLTCSRCCYYPTPHSFGFPVCILYWEVQFPEDLIVSWPLFMQSSTVYSTRSSNMAQLVGSDEIDSLRIELSEIGRSLRSSFRRHTSCFRSNSALTSLKDDADDEYTLQWAAIDRLPTFERLKSSLFDEDGGEGASVKGKRVTDVTKLGALERHMFIEKLIKHIENDNLHLLQKLRKRISKVGVKLPTVEVRYKSLHVEAECEVVYGKPLPTLWNSVQSILYDMAKIPGLKSKEAKINIINDVSGIIKPGRMTLLLGPPGSGKTSLLKALSGNLNKSLKVAGEVSYNGYKLEEFVPQKISAYISQNDLHIPEMTVREALDFSARCQGVGSRAEIMREVSRREKEAGIVPDPDVDTYMKAISVEGQKVTLQTDYTLKILGLDICADTLCGDAMRRGISGGQKKRLTTGEMIVGPTKALFMDEISSGLDSSTTYQIIACLQQLAHITDATVLVSLLQPAPESFDLFDDIILMAEGKIVYHGPRSQILEFFEGCGLRCPERKGVADFLQEVISRKDQAQYWHRTEQTHSYMSVDMLSRKFKESPLGNKLDEELSEPLMKSEDQKNDVSLSVYSLSKGELFRACMSREFLLMRRNSFIYVFKIIQLFIIASITMTVFLRTRMDVDVVHANYYLGSLFYSLVILLVDGFPELSMTVARLSVFYKQRELYFYPAWAYAIPATLLKVPLSLVVALVWTSLTYYVIGYSPEAGRFFRQLVLLFAVHLTSISMYRFLASVFQTVVASTTAASMPIWLKWGFWVSPLTYGEIGLAVNEFLAPRWQKIGPPGSRAIISHEKLSHLQGTKESNDGAPVEEEPKKSTHSSSTDPLEGRMVLPFEPLSIVFQDVQYYVETPLEVRERGFTQKRLQLLGDVTGSFRPGVLTALMGVSGAGKTTLLDVLSGRKTSGTIEGEIKIGGYPKVQETFARISGYCEQSDVHSPQITVEESVVFSAWLRLQPQIDSKTKFEFVKEVLETIELDGIKDELVGMPGVSGLSTEQRKRLTIAVELVANPSIIFMDEPTTGLDARAAAIVMRAVKNVVETGRTIVCTIHQPSIDIFEAFDELILLKAGGRIIYCGPLGLHSSRVIEYFEGITGVSKIRDNYNPATWMLEITSASAEAELGIDFAEIYKTSALYGSFCEQQRASEGIEYSTSWFEGVVFPNSLFTKWLETIQMLPLETALVLLEKSFIQLDPFHAYALFIFAIWYTVLESREEDYFGYLLSLNGRNNQQSLFNIFGAMFAAVIFCGINNSSSVIPYVTTERSVLYRERFAGMYAAWAYGLAQVTIEIPYLLAQTLAFVVITYPMIGYYWSASKICLDSCSLFLQQVPKWWIWLYYLTPTSWTLNGMLSSQFGDVEKEIVVFGETKTISAFVKDYFGYNHDHLPIVAFVMILYPILFASVFTYAIGKLNFQRR
ncbi:hypothetical protein RJ639_043320 [Escallonia herrerae]|uniref:ABC transporter domain-containing protein n=1 Tax=Escallonia herrerae TaxID=1293975 RepID=A0AA88WDF8_9ASTE|nr:hypothetical protein RJ639_043320 [Escallonia herrerae]